MPPTTRRHPTVPDPTQRTTPPDATRPHDTAEPPHGRPVGPTPRPAQQAPPWPPPRQETKRQPTATAKPPSRDSSAHPRPTRARPHSPQPDQPSPTSDTGPPATPPAAPTLTPHPPRRLLRPRTPTYDRQQSRNTHSRRRAHPRRAARSPGRWPRRPKQVHALAGRGRSRGWPSCARWRRSGRWAGRRVRRVHHPARGDPLPPFGVATCAVESQETQPQPPAISEAPIVVV